MPKAPEFLIVLALVLLVSACASPVRPTPTPAWTPAPAFTSTLTADEQSAIQIEAALTALNEKNLFSGSVLIARDGHILLSQGYGLADIEQQIPNTPQTKFRIGSVSKQFTATAILILQHQGKLKVKDPICKYIDNCPAAWQRTTIHHLLTHTSGIYNITNSVDYLNFKKRTLSPDQIMDLFRDLPLDFNPGERWSYSNSGYILLGAIIEKTSGRPFASFLQQNILDPLQMKDSGYDESRPTIQNHGVGYKGATAEADYIDMSIPFSAGALYSTVADLYKWDQALYTEKLLPAAERDQAFLPYVQMSGLISYGYGWMIGKQFDQTWIMHAGGIAGFVSIINRFPDSQTTIILLSNHENTNLGAVMTTIAPMLFGGGTWINPGFS